MLIFLLHKNFRVEDAQQISEQVLSSARKSEESSMDLASILIVAAQVNAQVGKYVSLCLVTHAICVRRDCL